MHSLRATAINEAWKIGARRKSVFFLILTALIPIGAAILLSRFQSGFGIAAVTSSDFPILMLNILTLLVLPLLVFMAAADMFAGELGDKTLRITLTRPVTRFKVFTAKHIALLLMIAVHLAVGFLSSVIASAFLARSGSVATAILHSFVAYAAAIVPMMALGIVATCLAQLFKNGSGALTVCILLYALLKAVAYVFPALNVYSPTAYTDWHLLWIGQTVAAGKVISITSFLAACGILFFTAGYVMFDKKEL